MGSTPPHPNPFCSSGERLFVWEVSTLRASMSSDNSWISHWPSLSGSGLKQISPQPSILDGTSPHSSNFVKKSIISRCKDANQPEGSEEYQPPKPCPSWALTNWLRCCCHLTMLTSILLYRCGFYPTCPLFFPPSFSPIFNATTAQPAYKSLFRRPTRIPQQKKLFIDPSTNPTYFDTFLLSSSCGSNLTGSAGWTPPVVLVQI